MNLSNVPKRPYQICKRCVMDTSDFQIRFNSKGICNHCTDYIKKRLSVTAYQHQKTDSLENLFESIKKFKSPSADHDVAVGISGGTDSSTVVYLASKAGLKVLAIHMDNCWDTPIAAQNIKNLIDLPNVDYYCQPLEWHKFKKIQKAFLESGLPDIELPTDSAVADAQFKIAKKFNINAVLSGCNHSNEGILPASWMYNPKDSLFVNSVLKSKGLDPAIFSFIKFGFKREFKYKFIDGIRTFYPLNKFKYDKSSSKKMLAKEINWKYPPRKHGENIYTQFNQYIYMPRRHNADYRRPHLSQDIILKRTTREEALEELKKSPYHDIDVDYIISFVSNKLGYSISELNDIIEQPPLWYVDFPNREKLLRDIFNLYRIFTNRKLSSTWW